MRITTGLVEFQIYLDYLQKEYESNKGNVEAVQISTKALIQTLRQKVSLLVPSLGAKKSA